MEGSSNGKLEETPKAEAHDEEKEVLGDSAVSKPDVEFARHIVADSKSMSVNETPDGDDSSSSGSSSDKEAEPEETSHHVENPKTFEEEKLISYSVTKSVEHEPGVSLTEEFNQDIEPSVEKPGESGVAELDAKEKEENISPSLDETSRDPGLLADAESKGIDKETTLPGSDENDGSMFAAAVVSTGVEESTISSLADNAGVPTAAVARGITETKIPTSESNAGGSSGTPALEAKQNVEESSQAENVPTVETTDPGEQGTKPDVQESTGNQSVTSASQRTSWWWSCCGLFEVLRRSER